MRALAIAIAALVWAPSAAARETLTVVAPDRENLQFMSFWLADAAGLFAEEGLDVQVKTPSAPAMTGAYFEESDAEAAVLPPPIYLRMIAERKPIVLVANLLSNDPIELVVRRSVIEERRLDPTAPLRARLEGTRGLRVGIAPHPPARMRALFAAEGLDADRDVQMIILHGKEQNAAFREGKVDALFAHTPYVERALVHDDAVVLVDLSRGDAPVLATRQIHALAFKRRALETRRDLALRAVRAIARAQSLAHATPSEAAAAIARKMPERDHREIDTIVRLYEPAIPKSPDVRAEDLPRALALFPANMPKPSLDGVPLAEHVASDVVAEATSPAATNRMWQTMAVVALALVAATLAAAGVRRARAARDRA